MISIDIGSRNLGVAVFRLQGATLLDSELLHLETIDALEEHYAPKPVPKSTTQAKKAEAVCAALRRRPLCWPQFDPDCPGTTHVAIVAIEVQGAQQRGFGANAYVVQSANRPIGQQAQAMYQTRHAMVQEVHPHNHPLTVSWVSAQAKRAVYDNLDADAEYRDRKDAAEMVARRELALRAPQFLPYLEGLKKKDDAADAYLQGLGYGMKQVKRPAKVSNLPPADVPLPPVVLYCEKGEPIV